MASRHTGLLAIVVFCFAYASSDDFNIRYLQSCEDICDKYAFNSGGNGNIAESCARGCRFFSILSLLHDGHDTNTTIGSCESNCDEAYSRQRDREACHWGCRNQQHTSVAQIEEALQGVTEERDVAMTHMLYPLLYMHSVYSNVLDKVHSHMEVSWSVYTNGDSGELVVVRSQPHFIQLEATDMDDVRDSASWPGDGKTSGYVETNIVGQDNSATPLLSVRPSQIRAANHVHPDTPHHLQLDVEGKPGRLEWWRCVVKKTDVGRVVLCILILAMAVVIIWFALSAVTTAPDQCVQHISINGDLEYLRSVPEKDSFKLLHPQDRVEARPLPIKIRVERI